jgi:DNA polymerase-3 subunit gamma/tau
MSSARAAINAALEAARSASRGSQPQAKRSTAQSNQAAAQAPAAAQEVAPPARPAPQAPTPPPPSAGSAPPPWQTPAAPVATQATAAPAAARAGPTAAYDDAGSEPPSWVTEFSDDTALAQDGAEVATMPVAAPVAAPVPARAQAAPKHAYVVTPVTQLGWDGNWPALAADLPLRGVAQQLAFQTELIECVFQGNAATFRLRVPIDTLRASGNSEKLCAAVQERFPDIKVILETELGPVWYTASAEAQAWREACLRTAEQTVADDPFVQGMIRTFDAFVVPGSIKPAPTA